MRLFAKACAFLSVGFTLLNFHPAQAQEKISGPYTHENLSIYLIHGPDRAPGKHFVTLGEACRAFPPKGVSAATLARWIQRGIKVRTLNSFVKLETLVIGGRRFTSREAIARTSGGAYRSSPRIG